MVGDTSAGEDIILAQTGNRDIREQLISEHLPLIRRTVRRLTHAVFVEQMDEFSIALSAFDEAIDRYRNDSQVPFACYARILIKHRLIDWYRKQEKEKRNVSLSQPIADTDLTLADQLADPVAHLLQDRLEAEESLLRLQAQVEHLGCNMADLVDRFPKHRDTRLLCIRLARSLISDAAQYQKLLQQGRLPCKALSQSCDVPVKTIERNRPAVILLSVLLSSDLPGIRSYIDRYEAEEPS